MRTRLNNLWDRLAASFWLLPALATICCLVLFFIASAADAAIGKELPWQWLETTHASAQTTLSVIAGSMMTIVGVVFSTTMVTFSIAASQYGSRVLRSRMQDRVTQVALATFLSTSVYSLVALRASRSLTEDGPPPNLTVAVAICMAVISLVYLVYFIHHVATVIQAPELVANLATDLQLSVGRLFPKKIDDEDDESDVNSEINGKADDYRTENFTSVPAGKDGYIQGIDKDALIELAKNHDVVLELVRRPGDFISSAQTFAKIYPAIHDKDRTDEISRGIAAVLITGNRRTPRQDINCTVHEVAQVAVRALSPGINDPYTAMNCIDRLSSAAADLAQRRWPRPLYCDDENQVRLISYTTTFPAVLAASFSQIQANSRDSAAVTLRLLEGFERIAESCRRKEDLDAVTRAAESTISAFHANEFGDDMKHQLDFAIEGFNDIVANSRHRIQAESSSAPEDEADSQAEQEEDAQRATLEGEVSG